MFAMLPVIGVGLGVLAGGFTSRYVVAATIGFAAGFACLVPRRGEAATVALVVVASVVMATLSRRVLTHEALVGPKVPAVAVSAEGLPIVYQGPHQFMQTQFYESPSIAGRMYFLIDASLEYKWTGQNSFSSFLRPLSHFAGFHTEDYRSFIAEHPEFLLVTETDDAFPWVLTQLSTYGARIGIRSARSGEIVYDVMSPRPGM